jgi:hypothetical protein
LRRRKRDRNARNHHAVDVGVVDEYPLAPYRSGPEWLIEESKET